MYAITGASGQLGRLVVDALLRTTPADEIVALVRQPAKAADLAARGVEVRAADYDQPDTFANALAGIDKVLLISSSEIGRRVPQHRAVIEAAARNGVRMVAYTSVLHADTSPLGLAEEHRQTEDALRASGLSHVLLRNGWYTENHLAGLAAARAHGVLMGAAGEGRIAAAARADYAEAAAVALTRDGEESRTYELAGDSPWTLAELAREISRQTGQSVAYRDLPKADYEAALIGAGLPSGLAELIADADACARAGALDDASGDLRRLIGRATTALSSSVRAALAAAP